MFLGALVIVVGLMAFLASFTAGLGPLGWWGLTKMAAPTAAVFVVLGAATVSASWRDALGPRLTPFSSHLWRMVGCVAALAIAFALYARSKGQVTRANELRHRSFRLFDELRQSGDDLTRMARTYVVTGDRVYRQHFQAILDIRDGRKPRPEDYGRPYWDLVLGDGPAPRGDQSTVPLLELMRRARFTAAECGKLAETQGKLNDLDRERQRAEQEVRTLNADLERRVEERTAQLEAANRELEAFSYSVSHDLRAPLRAIDGYGRMLVEDHEGALDPEGRRVLGVISSETKRMAQLIDDLLDFSRLGRRAMAAEDVDMTAMAGVVFGEQAAQSPQRALRLDLRPLPATHGDRTLLRVAWVNLLSNAIKFTKHQDPAVIEIGGRREAGQVVYSVKDNGVGFDMNYAHKLFGVFQRLHSAEEFEGTGVGLALVQRVIHRHGGRVWAEARVDAGATFYFALPGREGNHVNPTGAPVSHPRPDGVLARHARPTSPRGRRAAWPGQFGAARRNCVEIRAASALPRCAILPTNCNSMTHSVVRGLLHPA